MVRGRDPCWEHCVLVDATRQKVRCNYCHREFSGGVYRMKFHLAQITNKDIIPCPEVSDDVRDHIRTILSTPKKHKTSKKLKVDPPENAQENSSSGTGDLHPNHGSSSQRGSMCASLLFPNTGDPIDDARIKKQDNADKKIAVFFYHNSIPFSASKSIYYKEMFDAVAECGSGYKPPSYENLRSTLLDKVKLDVHDWYKKYRDQWRETGCTILCESLFDGKTKSFLVFSVTCTKGTLFLKSVNISGHEDDSGYLFQLLESILLEVGVENVVQVITDNTPSYVYAGRHLMAKYPLLFWSPCASYCINKMLEDIGEQEWVASVLEEANTITTFLYSDEWSLNMMRRFTGGREFSRPRITRFVSKFLSLRALVAHEENLIHMLSNSRHPDAQVIKSLLYQDRFWKFAHEAISVSEPLVRILRILDGDMPAMGYIYEGLERAKVVIKAYYKGMEEKYMPIWDIVDRRWNMHSPLHAAAAFLNPSIFYNPSVRVDPEIRNGFQEAMMKMATLHKDKIEITKEHPMYINAQGAFATDFAIIGRTLNSPGDWWAGFGYEIPTLQRVAVRILSQPCSLHWCRWNWGTFESIYSKKRSKEEVEKLNDLVFVHCNLWLHGINKSRDGKCGAIVYDEIDVDSEWPTESEPSIPLLDDSWLDNFPHEFRTSP